VYRITSNHSIIIKARHKAIIASIPIDNFMMSIFESSAKMGRYIRGVILRPVCAECKME